MRRSLIGWRLCNSANSLTVYTPVRAALLELLVDDLATCSVFVALKGGRQGCAQLLDQAFHRDRQSVSAAGG